MPMKEHRTLSCRHRSSQSGVSLIESLVALVVLALGIMGLAGIQARILVENRTASHRATAIGLIDDLKNRMLLNQAAAASGLYTLAWAASKTSSPDCIKMQCSAGELAQADLSSWRQAVATLLPAGAARVFISPNDGRQIGIAVSWSVNESSAADLDSIKYNSPFAVTAANQGVDCPISSLCHVVYVQP